MAWGRGHGWSRERYYIQSIIKPGQQAVLISLSIRAFVVWGWPGVWWADSGPTVSLVRHYCQYRWLCMLVLVAPVNQGTSAH